MQRSRLKNIINKSKALNQKIEPFDAFKKSLPKEIEIGDNYRLEAAWKAYGSPKNYQEALWEGMIQPIDENTYKLPSIGYNEETDEYEYLNKGKENETVAKDIRVWDNDVIPFVKELKQGGFIRTFDEEKDCWKYSKFQEGGKTKVPEFLTYDQEKDIYISNHYGDEKDAEDFKWYNSKDAKEFRKKYRMMPLSNDKIVYADKHVVNDILKKQLYDQMGGGGLSDVPFEDAIYTDAGIAYKTDEQAEDGQYFYVTDDGERFTKYELHQAPESFKQGGQMNVIPEGALHARKNNMDLAKEGEVTHKGIPVIDNEGNQTAEVEKEEWTMTKELTEAVEEWCKKYYDEETSQKEKDELAIKCGKRICKELLHNTDDRAGLIERMEEEL